MRKESDTYAEGIKDDVNYIGKRELGDIISDKSFYSVSGMLSYICSALGKNFVENNWEFDEDTGCFYTDFLVDNNNNEVYENELIYERWQNGDADLYNQRVMIKPEIVLVRNFTKEDL